MEKLLNQQLSDWWIKASSGSYGANVMCEKFRGCYTFDYSYKIAVMIHRKHISQQMDTQFFMICRSGQMLFQLIFRVFRVAYSAVEYEQKHYICSAMLKMCVSVVTAVIFNIGHVYSDIWIPTLITRGSNVFLTLTFILVSWQIYIENVLCSNCDFYISIVAFFLLISDFQIIP